MSLRIPYTKCVETNALTRLAFHVAVGFIRISMKFSDESLRRKLPPSVTIRRMNHNSRGAQICLNRQKPALDMKYRCHRGL